MPDLTIRSIMKTIMTSIDTVVIEKKKRKFVIYTNGMGGRLVKDYLETKYAIKPEYTIDNKAYDGTNILNIEQAKNRDNRDVYFLICSWHGDYYKEIRKKIYDVFPEEQIIDLFPRIDRLLPTDEEIFKVLQYINTYMER